MSDAAMDASYCLRVMINKDKTKVLFAEADNDFVSLLLSFLALPLGRIAKLLKMLYGDKAPSFGSITTLYKGLSSLDDVHFKSEVAKLFFLHSPSSCDDSIFSKLKLHVFEHSPKYFVGSSFLKKNCYRNCIGLNIGGDATCKCEMPLKVRLICPNDSKSVEVPFLRKTASFIITDDFKLVPNSAVLFQTLVDVTVADGAELRNLTLGNNEIMNLLKCSLFSKTPFTDMVLNKGEIISSAEKPGPGIFLDQIVSEANAGNIILKVTVHKSTNKVLFAEADYDFIELLFSFLLITIGGFESLLDNNTCLNNLDNLYKSISNGSLDKYFISLDTKRKLLDPNIPQTDSTRLFYQYHGNALRRYCEWNILLCTKSFFTFKSTVCEGKYVSSRTTYLVTDDLTVTPFNVNLANPILGKLNIPISDVEELAVHIGLQEALGILKASLISNSALNNGLINRLMKKRPKQER